MKLIPMEDRVVVKPQEAEEKTAGGIVLPDTAKEKPDFVELVKTHPAVLKAAATKNAALFGVRSAYGDFAPELSGSAAASKKIYDIYQARIR